MKKENNILQKILEYRNSKDKESLEEILFYYEKYIYSIISKRNINYFNKEDLIQEGRLAIINAINNIKEEKIGKNIDSYIYKYIDSYIINYIKKEYEDNYIDFSEEINENLLGTEENSIIDNIELKYNLDYIRLWIEETNTMSKKEKEFIQLILDGKKNIDLKKKYNLSLDRIKSIKKKLLEKIKKEIKL